MVASAVVMTQAPVQGRMSALAQAVLRQIRPPFIHAPGKRNRRNDEYEAGPSTLRSLCRCCDVLGAAEKERPQLLNKWGFHTVRVTILPCRLTLYTPRAAAPSLSVQLQRPPSKIRHISTCVPPPKRARRVRYSSPLTA